MSFSNVLEKVIAKVANRQRERATDFISLAREIAEGKEPAVATIEAALIASGKTLDDLRELATTIARRQVLKSKLEALPRVEKDRTRVEAEITSAGKALQEADEKHTATLRPLQVEINRLDSAIGDATAARSELFSECPYPELRERYDAAMRAARKTGEAAERCRERVRTHKGEMRLSAVGDPNERESREEAAELRKEAERRLPIAERDLAEALVAQTAAAKKLAAAEAAMLNP